MQLRRVAPDLRHVYRAQQFAVGREAHRTPGSGDQGLGQLGDAAGRAGADVVGLAGGTVGGQQPVGPDHVAHVGEVASRVQVPDPDHLRTGALVGRDARCQRGRHEAVALAGTQMVEGPGPDHVEPAAQAGLHADHLGRSLAGAVGRHRAHGGRLVDGEDCGLDSPVDVGAADDDHPAGTGPPGGLKYVGGSLHIDPQGGGRLDEARLHIGLGGQVVHRVGPASIEVGLECIRLGYFGLAGGDFVAHSLEVRHEMAAHEARGTGDEGPHRGLPVVAWTAHHRAH